MIYFCWLAGVNSQRRWLFVCNCPAMMTVHSDKSHCSWQCNSYDAGACVNCVTGQTKELGFRKARLSFPFPFFLLPFLLFISLCPEGLRMCYSSPSGSGQCPATKCFLVLFKLKIAEFQEMPYQLAAYCTVIVCRVFLIWWRHCLKPTLRCLVGILTGMRRFYVLSAPMGHSSAQCKV